MDLKHDLMSFASGGGTSTMGGSSVVREDVLLVKTEPRLPSPCGNNGNGLTPGGNLLTTTSGGLISLSTNHHAQQGNGLVVTTVQAAAGLVNAGNLLVTTNGLQGNNIQVNSLQGSLHSNNLQGNNIQGNGLQTNSIQLQQQLQQQQIQQQQNNGLSANGISFGLSVNANSSGNSVKRSRTDDWLSSPSPGSGNVPSGAAPPLTPSPGPPSHTYTVISNGYSSPMSSGSYDPYSPNGKIGKFFLDLILLLVTITHAQRGKK